MNKKRILFIALKFLHRGGVINKSLVYEPEGIEEDPQSFRKRQYMASRLMADQTQFGIKIDTELGVNGLHVMTDHLLDAFTKINAHMVS